jgi:hypothetical protein
VTLEAPGEDFDFDAGERAPRATSRIRRRAPGRTGRHPSRSSASSRPSPNRPRKRWSWTSATPGIEWQRLSDVEMRSIVFADKPPLQTDAFHLLAGRKGMGKGTLLAEIGSRVTRASGRRGGFPRRHPHKRAQLAHRLRVDAAEPERTCLGMDP